MEKRNKENAFPTSPPKSACPGVSTMFSSCSLHGIDVTYKRLRLSSFTKPHNLKPTGKNGCPFRFYNKLILTLEAMVIPRSRSRLIESSARSWGMSVPHWRRRRSMRVVLPWSTWAITATFRNSLGSKILPGVADVNGEAADAADKNRGRERR